MKFTNYTKGPKGVHTTAGLVYVDAGQTSEELDVTEAEAKAAKATGWFTRPKDPLDHDDNGKKGGSAPAQPEAKA